MKVLLIHVNFGIRRIEESRWGAGDGKSSVTLYLHGVVNENPPWVNDGPAKGTDVRERIELTTVYGEKDENVVARAILMSEYDWELKWTWFRIRKALKKIKQKHLIP